MIFAQLLDNISGFIETNLPLSIAVGFVFLLFLLKKPKYFIIVLLVLVGGIFIIDLFQKLAVKTGLGGF